jgi:crotonobetainyl-CoA:carnitine CoA-transferase CaiB-like acyl-CoA transferase
MAGNFLHLNRNKRSVVLDLKSEEGRAALDRLIETADVFVHAIRPQAIAKLGYTYDKVRAIKADIVYCGAYGFSAQGPVRRQGRYDDLIQAGCGIASLFVEREGAPAYVPTVLCDKVAGHVIASSIMAALFQRGRGGGGQAIEVPMFETMAEFVYAEHLTGFAFEPPLSKPGFNRVLSARRKPYRTKDGYACILPYSDRNWRDFFDFRRPPRAQGRRALQDSLGSRAAHRRALRLLEDEAVNRTTAEWVAFCDRVSIPSMPVLSLEDLPDDEHLKAVGLFGSDEHPDGGALPHDPPPGVVQRTQFRIRRHAPRARRAHGGVLSELGLLNAGRTRPM